jgi:hypothetical protein
VAGTATAVSNRVSRRQTGRWAEQEQQEPAPAATPSGDDTVAQLAQLGELRDKGVLTEEEFAAQKAKLLG